jgi:hypothetical protein
MNEVYEVRVDAKAGSSLHTLDPLRRHRLATLIARLGRDLGDVLASDKVVRIPDWRIIDRNDPTLAFFQWSDQDLEVGFYVDRMKKRISITSINANPQWVG